MLYSSRKKRKIKELYPIKFVAWMMCFMILFSSCDFFKNDTDFERDIIEESTDVTSTTLHADVEKTSETTVSNASPNNSFKPTPPDDSEDSAPIPPIEDDEENEDGGGTITPTSYTVYYGSIMKDVELTAEAIQSLDSVTDSKSISATFKQGYNRFVVAFPTAYASSLTLKSNPNTPLEVVVGTSEHSNVTINELTYRVYVNDVARNAADKPMSISLI